MNTREYGIGSIVISECIELEKISDIASKINWDRPILTVATYEEKE